MVAQPLPVEEVGHGLISAAVNSSALNISVNNLGVDEGGQVRIKNKHLIQNYLFVSNPPPPRIPDHPRAGGLTRWWGSSLGAGGALVSWPLAIHLWETARAPARPLRRLQARPLLHGRPLGGVAPGAILPCPVVDLGPEAPLPTFTSPCSSSFTSPCSKLPGVGVKTGLTLSQPGDVAEWPHFSDPVCSAGLPLGLQ